MGQGKTTYYNNYGTGEYIMKLVLIIGISDVVIWKTLEKIYFTTSASITLLRVKRVVKLHRMVTHL